MGCSNSSSVRTRNHSPAHNYNSSLYHTSPSHQSMSSSQTITNTTGNQSPVVEKSTLKAKTINWIQHPVKARPSVITSCQPTTQYKKGVNKKWQMEEWQVMEESVVVSVFNGIERDEETLIDGLNYIPSK